MEGGPCPKSRANKPASCYFVAVVVVVAAAAAAGSSASPYKPRSRNRHAAHQPGIQSYRALRRKRAGMKLNGMFTQSSLKNKKKKRRGGMQKGCRRTSTSTTQKTKQNKLMSPGRRPSRQHDD
ncbi:hypothetical protein TRV_07180 [Trichophyton verrucosum HKI 0517]|uniref:Uncharacterized protein n=1 Tax=Trichophyton verrucosum (strain HKI 0517) TaxID=663202 RepID=D4DJ15_TRIVH|nr:uncharacterized protein TRV_07180 [Trichophyton verrucosum HKI 0517]EFE38154.1 hypothetical protein TRV_07180 [Trichophyton verrucosum HKI 0517]